MILSMNTEEENQNANNLLKKQELKRLFLMGLMRSPSSYKSHFCHGLNMGCKREGHILDDWQASGLLTGWLIGGGHH